VASIWKTFAILRVTLSYIELYETPWPLSDKHALCNTWHLKRWMDYDNATEDEGGHGYYVIIVIVMMFMMMMMMMMMMR